MPTLESLGLAEAPREHPLTCPGGWPSESRILDGGAQQTGSPGTGLSLSPPLR